MLWGIYGPTVYVVSENLYKFPMLISRSCVAKTIVISKHISFVIILVRSDILDKSFKNLS